MLKCAVLIALLPAVVLGLTVRPCPGANPPPIPEEVRVIDCYVEPCIIPIGGMVDMDLDFIAGHSSNHVEATLDIFLGNFRVPYDLPVDQRNACHFFKGRGCPIHQHEKINYHLSTPASAPFADVTVDLQLQLTADNGQALFCFRSSARITAV